MDYWIAFYAFGTIAVTSYMVLMVGVGLVWSPFAFYIVYRRAYRYNLSPLRYGIIGAIYSILFLMPWFILFRRMRGDDFPIGFTFVICYLFWVLGPISSTFSLAMISDGNNLEATIVLATGLVMSIMLIGSLWRNISLSGMDISIETLPEYGYIVPFIGVMASELMILGILRFIDR